MKLFSMLFISSVFFFSCTQKKTIEPVVINMNQGENVTADAETNKYKNKNTGYILYDLSKNKVVESYNSRKSFIPASTQKIVTTVAAMDILGIDHKFITTLAINGSIRKNVLHGDLIIKGTGDPLFSMNNLMVFVTALQRKGIKEVKGKIIYDQSELPLLPEVDSEMDNDLSYNPGVSALSLDFNSIWAHWRIRKKRNIYDFVITPSHKGNYNSIDSVKHKEHVVYTYSLKNNQESWFLNKNAKRKYGNKRIPVKNPGKHSAYMFKKLCGIAGIKTGNVKPGTMPGGSKIISTHESPSLVKISGALITYSNNMMAEILAMAAAKKLTGEKQKPHEAMTAIVNHYKKIIKGVSWQDINLQNGSGLSDKTRMTPEQLTAFLIYASHQNYGRRTYRDLLTPAGWGWSMKKRLYHPETAFRVWAKTGTINYALGLSGYFFGKNGKEYAFTVFSSDIKKRNAFASIPKNRDPRELRKINRWIRYTKNNIDSLVTHWVKTY